MSFKVGQKLSTNISSEGFFTNEQRDIYIENFITKISNIQFTDKRISYNFVTDQNYYIRIKIQRKTSQQSITLRLTDESNTVYQEIDNFIIYPGLNANSNIDNPDQNVENSYATIQAVVSPNSSYSKLAVILDRELADFRINVSDVENSTSSIEESLAENALEHLGRIVEIGSYQIFQFQNLISGIEASKIGIQGPPGMLMCINGEGIRVGPSGIYEIKNGYKVNFLGIVQRNSQTISGSFGKDNFIIDYQYDAIDT